MLRFSAVLLAAFALTANAFAAPITYQQPVIPPGGTVAGVNNQTASNESNPVGATYHYFYAIAGSNVTVTGARTDNHFDMSFWLFQGLFNDTNDFGASFDSGDTGFLDFADDEIPHPGPFGDPQSAFVAPVTGFYTVAVTNYLSDPDTTPSNYTLTVEGNANVPEPASLAVFALVGLAGGVYARRRRVRVS